MKNILSKKLKTLENIIDKADEEFHRRCTFTPTININHRQNNRKRDLNKFVFDQLKYVETTEKKLERVKYIL